MHRNEAQQGRGGSCDGAAGGASKRQCQGIAVVQLCDGKSNLRQASLWWQGMLCDVQLRMDTEIEVFPPAHELVLVAESTFLFSLFTGQSKDLLAPIISWTSTRWSRASLRSPLNTRATAHVLCTT